MLTAIQHGHRSAAHSCTGHGSCSRREQIQISGESTGGSPSTQPHEHECRRGQACATASALRGKPANPAASRSSAEEATASCCERRGLAAVCQGGQGEQCPQRHWGQGKKKPKKAAAETTKGTQAAKKATGKGPGEGQKGQKGKGKSKGGGGSRPAPARAAKRKKRPIVCDSDVDDDDCDSDFAMEYGSKLSLGWGKKARVCP